jgi:hypothetical protein
MRAYLDPATKQLRGATLEERAQEAASSKSKTLAAPNARTRAASVAAEASEPEVESLANGLQAITLDESQMVYSVAHVDANGKASADCVGKQPNAEAALEVKVAPHGEHDNEK